MNGMGTALSVAQEYRRLHLAHRMIEMLEVVSDKVYKGYFVDLFVRCTNIIAIKMYEGLGYSVFRWLRE